LLASLASLARRWLVAAVAAAGDGQNILPMSGSLLCLLSSAITKPNKYKSNFFTFVNIY
jgi:hypothetical protein